MKKTVCIIFLFFFAFALRMHYQNISEKSAFIISDEREYFIGAYNLSHNGFYANDIEGKELCKRVPGYSMLISSVFYTLRPFFAMEGDDTITHPKGAENVVLKLFWAIGVLGAVIGSLTVVITFLLACEYLNVFWSFLVGVLMAVCPHAISLDACILSDSLYGFLLVAGIYLFVIGKRWEFISGVVFGLSMLVRPVSLLLVPVLSVFASRKTAFVFAAILTVSPLLVRNYIVNGLPFPTGNFGWISLVSGTYPGLECGEARYGYPYKGDPEFNKMLNDKVHFLKVVGKRVKAEPLKYAKWYLVEKWLYPWHWSFVTGSRGVYVYPMKIPGFHFGVMDDIRKAMKFLHSPLLYLMCFGIFLVVLCKKSLLYPVIALVLYHSVVYVVMFPIPRYTVPLRPEMYLLAVWALVQTIIWIKKEYGRTLPD